jgi:hypothetical protein
MSVAAAEENSKSHSRLSVKYQRINPFRVFEAEPIFSGCLNQIVTTLI